VASGTVFGQPKKEDGAPEEIPKPTILESVRFVGFNDGKVQMVARYTIVRSNHSNRIFAGGMQRRISGSKTWEEYNALSKKRRRKLYAGITAHHFDFDESGPLDKYKGWIQGGGKRIDYVLKKTSSGYNSWREGSGGNRSKKSVAPLGSIPYDANQIMLVRMAFKKAKRQGGTVSVVHPRTLNTGTLTVTEIGANLYELNGPGGSGVLETNASGRISSYKIGSLEFVVEPPK